MGYQILLIGRKSERSFGLADFPYEIHRFKNPFRRGPFMYLTFNIQLFFFLLFAKADILWSNDLDTLSPNFFVSKLKNSMLVYDSHEYFTESVYKKHSKKVWELLEKMIFPHLKNVITVNDSIRKVYEKKYKVSLSVIRNVPYRNKSNQLFDNESCLDADKKILVMQGMGLNENRGAEEAVMMMRYLPENFILFFIGSGTVLGKLNQIVKEFELEKRVIFLGVLPYDKMMEYTRKCYMGLIFEKIDFTDEHLFALPNRLFDYIKAGIPILSSKAVEIKSIIDQYQIGDFIDNFTPKTMAEKILKIASNESVYLSWKLNTIKAADELNWENEEKILINFMKHLS